ncbi:transposase [Pantoea dispersa]|nr:transposase [Pantoea dispersa]
MLDKWAYEFDIRTDFSRPGAPTDNSTVESFNGRLRQECLNGNWFAYGGCPVKNRSMGHTL